MFRANPPERKERIQNLADFIGAPSTTLAEISPFFNTSFDSGEVEDADQEDVEKTVEVQSEIPPPEATLS